MEESSEKRRERLQAMRAEASNQSQPEPHVSSSSIHSLSNPLINSASDERSPKTPRFDFYTDPMAAFSGSKRRNLSAGGGGPYCSPQTFSSPARSPSPFSYPLSNRPGSGPRNYHDASTHPPPGQQFQTHQSPDQGPWGSHPPPGLQFQTHLSHDQSPWRSHPPPGLQFQMNQSPDQSPWRSPVSFHGPFSGNIGGTPPSCTPNRSTWNRSGGASPRHGFTPNYSSRGGGLPNPSFSHGGSRSPYSNSGRGSGRHFRGTGGSPRSGRSGGGGQESRYGKCHAWWDSQHFYKAVMKDPWRKLKPIVGSILVPRSGSWLPKSIVVPKRTKVSESGAKSQLSLAESLALSLEEAANDE